MYSFQAVMNPKMLVEMSPGTTSGNRMLRRIRHVPAPSTIAASSTSTGIVTKKPRSVQIEKGSTAAT